MTTPHPFESSPLWPFNSASLSQAALAYSRVNVGIFPVEPRGKRPLTTHGCYDATTRKEIIREWWMRWPQANIGLPCNEWWALDIDPRHGGIASLKALQEELGADFLSTRVQLTGGGGAHLLYWARRDLEGTLPNATKFAGLAGLDLRVQGGYIVVAPSVHANGGVYQWHNTQPLLPFPDGLIDRWQTSRRRASSSFRRPGPRPHPFSRGQAHYHHGKAPYCGKPPCYLEYAIAQSSETWGRRHSFAMYLSYRLIEDVGMDGEDAAEWLCEFAAAVRDEGEEPFEEEEALDCLEYVIREAQQAA
ncbi:MAG TPA: bifunctional DNA primase/polymerase [Ktedonobacteraceae bacterium]|nr:bifunctional DNA primase/polymerase [Ktedonobacteraceae bacterium]